MCHFCGRTAVAPAAAELGTNSFQVLHCVDDGYGGETASRAERARNVIHRKELLLPCTVREYH
jgi:hypothetical protein